MKKRITISIDEELLRKLGPNKSRAIEEILRKVLTERPEKAIVLAGGSGGERCLKEVDGKSVLEWNLSLLKRYGVEKVLIALDKRGRRVKEKFGDGRMFGMSLSYVEEEKPLGTGGAIGNAKYFIDETCLVIYGDNYAEIDLEKFYQFHKKSGAMITIALKSLPEAKKYGNVLLEGNKVVEFVEKPKEAVSNIVSTGVFLIEPEVVERCRGSFEREVIPEFVEECKVYGYVFPGRWIEV